MYWYLDIFGASLDSPKFWSACANINIVCCLRFISKYILFSKFTVINKETGLENKNEYYGYCLFERICCWASLSKFLIVLNFFKKILDWFIKILFCFIFLLLSTNSVEISLLRRDRIYSSQKTPRDFCLSALDVYRYYFQIRIMWLFFLLTSLLVRWLHLMK